MNLFFWRKNKHIDGFARSIADELFSQVQPDVMSQYFSKQLDKKQAKIVEKKLIDSVKQITRFRIANKLGVYGKARLQLVFMERLEKLGYEKGIAKSINDFMVLNIS